jgi:hypothetical protein
MTNILRGLCYNLMMLDLDLNIFWRFKFFESLFVVDGAYNKIKKQIKQKTNSH